MKPRPFSISFALVRAPVAVLGGFLIGHAAQVPLALLLDFCWSSDVTVGRWPLTIPNIIPAVMVALIAGFSSGWIGGRFGKILGLATSALPFVSLSLFSLIGNIPLYKVFETIWDTNPVYWLSISILPSIVGGHFGALNGKYYFNRAAYYVFSFFGGGVILALPFLQIYTAFVAYKISGFIAGILTLSFPVISEIYWSIRISNECGSFFNYYTHLILLLVISCAIAGIAYWLNKKTAGWDALD